MKKFFILSLLNALLLLANYSLISATPPGPYEPAIEEYKKTKAAAEKEKRLKDSNVEQAKPQEVRDTAPKTRSEGEQLTGPKQMYKWRDGKGQWHFSHSPPAGVKAQQVGGIDKHGTIRSSTDLGRSYVGIALGESLASFSGTKKVAEQSRDVRGLRVFTLEKGQWPPGAEDLEVGFSQDNLVSIKVKYSSRYIETVGGWDALLQERAATYGNPAKANNKRALWKGNETGLLLVRGRDGGVVATFGDLKSAFTHQDLE